MSGALDRRWRQANPLWGVIVWILVAILTLMPGVASSLQSDDLRAALTDLPLPENLVIDERESFIFDKPDGRIVRLRLTGPGPASAIQRYFQDLLPGLGWRRVSESGTGSAYQREGEALMLSVMAPDPGRVQVEIEIRPESAPR